MIDMEKLLYDKIRPVAASWQEPDIYAVSFFVYSNEEYRMGEWENLPTFEISFNTESNCNGAGRYSEERWNYAFWPQDTTSIIDPNCPDSMTNALFAWFREQGVEDPGEEEDYEEGPIGWRMLVKLAGRVARRLRDEGMFPGIPILIHDLEYTECTKEATRFANPGGEAEDFLADWEDMDLDDLEPDDDIASSIRGIFHDVLAKLTDHADELKEEIIDEVDDLTESKLDSFFKKIFGK